MAYITGEFKHEASSLVIQVLQPERKEYHFKEGLKVDVDFDKGESMSLDELKDTANWILKTVSEIEVTYNKNGTKK